MQTEVEDELFTEIGINVNNLKSMIEEWVEGKKELKSKHRDEVDAYERRMFTFLWRCRKLLSTTNLSKMIGMSRQTLYEKWEKYGFNINES